MMYCNKSGNTQALQQKNMKYQLAPKIKARDRRVKATGKEH